MKRVVSAVLVAVVLAQAPTGAVKFGGVNEKLNYWSRTRFCDGMMREGHWFSNFVGAMIGC